MALHDHSVLLVEDEILIALDLAEAVADQGGSAVGPAVGNRQALALLSTERITAAIVDVNLRDGEATPTADALMARGIPFVLYSGSPLPGRLRAIFGPVPLLPKPLPSDAVIAALARVLAETPVLEPA